MKKYVITILLAVLAVAAPASVFAQSATPPTYNFGDHKSSTLANKAWQALAEKNTDAVLAYANKCTELYDSQAREMQAGLKEYPVGDDQKIFSYWALNDSATIYYVLGEAYMKAGQTEKAKEAYEKVANNYSFGQTYDPAQKIFWKPAQAAKEKLTMIEKGIDLDFSDLSSSTLVRKAWEALSIKNLDMVKGYTDKVISLYAPNAKSMQASLKEYPWESKEKIFSYWALNDIGTAYFILGEVYRLNNKKVEAIEAYKTLISDYSYAQCWDTQGWFWKPSEAAQQKVIELEAMGDASPITKAFNK